MVLIIGHNQGDCNPPEITRVLLGDDVTHFHTLNKVQGCNFFTQKNVNALRRPEGGYESLIMNDAIIWTEQDNIVIGSYDS